MTRIPGPANPVARDASGYEYRLIPGRVWSTQAGLAPDISAMAWALASEAVSAERYPQYARAIGHAIVNAARRANLSVHARVTNEGVRLLGGRRSPQAGHYGRQSGRWCASLQWPHYAHLNEARRVLDAPETEHPAELWADLRIMDKGWQGGKKLAYDAEGIVKRRWLGRWAWVGPLPGIDPYVLCLFRIRRPADVLDDAMRMVSDGRRRWGFPPA